MIAGLQDWRDQWVSREQPADIYVGRRSFVLQSPRAVVEGFKISRRFFFKFRNIFWYLKIQAFLV
jgi:hypothetical protein